jgi:transposase
MKKLLRRPVHFKGFTLGLDLHKKFIEYAVLDENGDQCAGDRLRSGEPELRRLLADWQARGAVQLTIEACGCFVWVFDLAAEVLGRKHVHVAQSAKVKMIANSQEKNDANDAWWLAYLTWEGRLPEAFVAEGALRELRVATREHRSYTDERSDLLRRFSAHFAQAGRGVPKEWARSKVKRAAVCKLIAEYTGAARLALHRLYVRIRSLTREIQRWALEVQRLSQGFAEVEQMIQEVPGLGRVTAATVYAELGNPRRFHSEKAYAKSTGLTPGYRISAGKVAGTVITRQGSRAARWALTQAAMACLRCKRGAGAQVRQWMLRRFQHRPKKKVVVAAARKLAEGVWRLFALGECWDLERAFPGKARARAVVGA